MTGRFRRHLLLAVLSLCWLFGHAAPVMAQQAVKTRAGAHADYGRIVFEWPAKTGYSAQIIGKELRITFDKPFTASYAVFAQKLGDYVGKPITGKNGAEVRFPLRQAFALKSRQFGNVVVIDLLKNPPAEDRIARKKAAEKKAAEKKLAVKQQQPAEKKPVRKKALKNLAEEKNQAASKKDEKPDAPVTPAKSPAKPDDTATAKPAADSDAAQVAAAPSPVRGAKVVSQRSSNTIKSDRERAIAQELEAREQQEEQEVGKALANAKTLEEEKQAAFTDDGQIDFELRVKEIAGGLRMRFPFSKDVAGAVFMRGGQLWIAFDKPAHVDLSILPLLKHDVLMGGEQLEDREATILAFKVAPGYLPTVVRQFSVWQVDLLREAGTPDGILPVIREPQAEPGGLVRIQAGNPTGPFSVIDPAVGDTILISPVLEATQAVVEKRKYVDFELLNTSQGIAVVASSGRLKVSAAPGAVAITSEGGLQISDDVARALGTAGAAGAARVTPLPPAFMDFDRWRRGTAENFYDTRQQLVSNVAATKLKARLNNQMVLAQFYLSHRLAAEARGVLNIMAREDANVTSDSYYSALSGVTNYYLGRLPEAEKDLTVSGLSNDSHAKLWLGAVKARQNAWKEALIAFDSGLAVMGKYSTDIAAEMRTLAGTAALAVDEKDRAQRELNNVKIDALATPLASEARLLQASLLEARGKNDEALDAYDKVIAAHHRPSEIPARLSRLLLLNRMGSLDNAKTIEQLEGLRFAWRGDDTELKILEALGMRYAANESYREALTIMRGAVTYYPATDRSSRIADRMNEIFADLYLRNASDAMPAIKALALYYDFRELTPLGADGDEMIRRLGERLVAVDLLDEAIELLDHQVRFRLEGTAKAQVAVRLAVIQLLDKQPARALDTIRRTRQTRLPEDLTFKRLMLEGRALSELGEFDQALELIAGIDVAESNLLRADIYWSAQDWPNAALALARVLSDNGPQPADKPLDAAIQSRVMRAAIAYALAGQQDGLDKLRTLYVSQMAATPYADSFDVISRSSANNGVAFRQLASTIAGLDTLKDFMATYRRDL